jgi:hypothetical protein
MFNEVLLTTMSPYSILLINRDVYFSHYLLTILYYWARDAIADYNDMIQSKPVFLCLSITKVYLGDILQVIQYCFPYMRLVYARA